MLERPERLVSLKNHYLVLNNEKMSTAIFGTNLLLIQNELSLPKTQIFFKIETIFVMIREET